MNRLTKTHLALFGGGETTVVASTNVADAYDGVSNEPSGREPNHHLNGFTIRMDTITRN